MKHKEPSHSFSLQQSFASLIKLRRTVSCEHLLFNEALGAVERLKATFLFFFLQDAPTSLYFEMQTKSRRKRLRIENNEKN